MFNLYFPHEILLLSNLDYILPILIDGISPTYAAIRLLLKNWSDTT